MVNNSVVNYSFALLVVLFCLLGGSAIAGSVQAAEPAPMIVSFSPETDEEISFDSNDSVQFTAEILGFDADEHEVRFDINEDGGNGAGFTTAGSVEQDDTIFTLERSKSWFVDTIVTKDFAGTFSYVVQVNEKTEDNQIGDTIVEEEINPFTIAGIDAEVGPSIISTDPADGDTVGFDDDNRIEFSAVVENFDEDVYSLIFWYQDSSEDNTSRFTYPGDVDKDGDTFRLGLAKSWFENLLFDEYDSEEDVTWQVRVVLTEELNVMGSFVEMEENTVTIAGLGEDEKEVEESITVSGYKYDVSDDNTPVAGWEFELGYILEGEMFALDATTTDNEGRYELSVTESMLPEEVLQAGVDDIYVVEEERDGWNQESVIVSFEGDELELESCLVREYFEEADLDISDFGTSSGDITHIDLDCNFYNERIETEVDQPQPVATGGGGGGSRQSGNEDNAPSTTAGSDEEDDDTEPEGEVLGVGTTMAGNDELVAILTGIAAILQSIQEGLADDTITEVEAADLLTQLSALIATMGTIDA